MVAKYMQKGMGHTPQIQVGESGILNEGVAQLLGTLNTNAIP